MGVADAEVRLTGDLDRPARPNPQGDPTVLVPGEGHAPDGGPSEVVRRSARTHHATKRYGLDDR